MSRRGLKHSMSLKSMFHLTRDEIGSISMKLRSRSQRVVHDNAVVVPQADEATAAEGCCWSSLPPELLREVLARVESDGDTWPSRMDVVACAGVCRNWRSTMKEIVRTPQLSGKITFPVSLKQPGPTDFPLQCFIKRNRSNQTYHLYLGLTQDAGKFLLAAKKWRRPTCTDYIISLDEEDMSKGSSTCVGKLRSNFLGTKFVVLESIHPFNGVVVHNGSTSSHGLDQVSPTVPAGDYPVCHIAYDLNDMGSRGPRQMRCIMNSIPASAIQPEGTFPTQMDFSLGTVQLLTSKSLSRSKSFFTDSFMSGPSLGSKEPTLILKNKAPRWHEQLQCWGLNFHGRVTVPSVKNFQLVASSENVQYSHEHDRVLLQFGKVAKDLFTMDYSYPLSAFQAFAICLSSFDTRIACE